MLEQAQLASRWSVRPLRLFLCPPAALCCQGRPEGPALIMAMRPTATPTRGCSNVVRGPGRRGHASPRVPYPETRRPSAVRECVCVCERGVLAVLLASVWPLCIKMGPRLSPNFRRDETSELVQAQGSWLKQEGWRQIRQNSNQNSESSLRVTFDHQVIRCNCINFGCCSFLRNRRSLLALA